MAAPPQHQPTVGGGTYVPGARGDCTPPGHVVWTSMGRPDSLYFLRNALFPCGMVLGRLLEQPFLYQDIPIALPDALLEDVGSLMQQCIPFQIHWYSQGFADMSKVS